MELYKKEFIEFLVRSSVVTFGSFVTKSGRPTPYFINSGNFKTGRQIQALGHYYSQAIDNHFGCTAATLFGPAYKGIPLVVTTAMALSALQNRDIFFCFNRKEAKDHGEGGLIIGRKLCDGDSVIIVEDVITAGTSIREVVPLLKKQAAVTVAGVIVSV
ncbi:MAG: orotate phosphoribosyltransferase, partial [Chitinivibrionales bacterium]|nr:orotate phosphoribosyltransferase [Chitinivibrionales bacterium]